MSIALWNKSNGEELIRATTGIILTHCWCGIPVGVPAPLYQYAKDHSQQPIYCPLGHTFVFSDAQDKEMQRVKDRNARLVAANDQLIAQEKAQRAAKTRFKNERDRERTRARGGVCPVPGCGRTFKQLARHMDAKHPDYPHSHD